MKMIEKYLDLVEKQRKRIMLSAEKCFNDIGLAKTTMRDIAKQADMSLGNIYRYFKNKKLLLQEFIKQDNQELIEAFNLLDNTKYFKETLLEIGYGYIASLSTLSNYLIYLDILTEAMRDQSTLDIMNLDKNEQCLVKHLKAAVNSKKIKLTLSPETTAAIILSFLDNIALKIILKQQYSLKVAKKQFKELLFNIIK